MSSFIVYRGLHRPADRIVVENHAGTDIQEIGHDDLDASWPEVTSFFREYDRDIAQLMERGVTQKHPIIVSAAIRCIGGTATILRRGQMVDQIADIFPIGAFARAWHGKDVRPAQVLDAFEGRIGRIARIGKHHDLTPPRWRLKVPQHLTKQDMLMALTLGIDGREGAGNSKTLPTDHQHHHTNAKGLGR